MISTARQPNKTTPQFTLKAAALALLASFSPYATANPQSTDVLKVSCTSLNPLFKTLRHALAKSLLPRPVLSKHYPRSPTI